MQNDDIRAIEELINYFERENTVYKQVRDIEPISSWLDSSYYIGHQSKQLYKFWKDVLIEFEQTKKTELVITGSIGGGKTDCAVMGFLRKFYLLSCFDFPQLMLDLGKGSSAVFFYMGLTQQQAILTGFGRLIKYIDDSPYFKENFPRNKQKDSLIEFPGKTVQCVAGSELGAFTGADLLGLILDEGNFLRAGGGSIGAFNKAKDIYVSSSTRIKSRYGSDSPYAFQAIVSSSDTQTSFVEQRIKESKGESGTMVVHSTKYLIKPDLFSKNNFYVFRGNDIIDPFVVDIEKRREFEIVLNNSSIENISEYSSFVSYEDVKIPETLTDFFIKMPIDFLKEAKLNTANTLKEIAGIPVHATGKFFTDHVAFQSCINYESNHPFRAEAFEVSTGIKDNEFIDMWDKSRKGEKGVLYYGHFDLAKSKDSGAFAFGHLGHNFKAIIDAMVLAHPPSLPNILDADKFREFIKYLKLTQGYNFRVFTSDQYQSQTAHPYLEKLGITSFIYSMDRSDEAWEYGKGKILSKAVEYYYHPRFEFELFSLIHDHVAGKVDHPPQNGIHAKDGGFGNDLTTCVFAVINHIFNYGRSEEERNQMLRSIIQSKPSNAIHFKSEEQIIKMEERRVFEKYNYKEGVDPFMRMAKAERMKKLRLFGKSEMSEGE